MWLDLLLLFLVGSLLVRPAGGHNKRSMRAGNK
jgi:hypothetical protein